MLPFPTFSVVGVRADGVHQLLADDLHPYREADELRAAMRASAEYSVFNSIVVAQETSEARQEVGAAS